MSEKHGTAKVCSDNTYSVIVVDWQSCRKQLQNIRQTVFIQEQHVPVELEWDGLDEQAVHILALANNEQHSTAIGCARILFSGQQAHIGRMAVLSAWRSMGVGTKILHTCINQCQQKNTKTIILNAQVYVLNFYQQAGFKISSDEFADAGIPHRKMTLHLKQSRTYD